jgi:peptide/nickel transport system substrate-binding protein
MKRNLAALLVTSLIMIPLLLASCNTTKTTTTAATTTPSKTTAPATTAPQTTNQVTEVPQYGGRITVVTDVDPRGFEDICGWDAGNTSLKLTHEELLTGDWTKGPAGSDLYDWAVDGISRLDGKTGSLAESWDLPEVGTIIFNIRHGIHFAMNPASEASRLVAGREITADDIASMLNRLISDPRATLSHTESKNAVITNPDNWTVQIKLPLSSFKEIVMDADYAICGFPKEATEKFGLPLSWQNSVGTGPFILTDYVTASSMTLTRNKNYWRTDPIGPGKGNQLPYADDVKILIIADSSTRLAALRTAKIDVMHRVTWEDAASLKSTSTEIKYKKYLPEGANAIFMRTDKANLPFKDIKVRRALMMATDFETIKNTWAGGDATILTYPISATKEYADCYLPLEEAPASVQELYVYSPDKAKALLAEAGYADGFDTKIICSNDALLADYISIIKEQWSKVGIRLAIDLKEPAVATSISLSRSHEQMEYSASGVTGNAFLGSNYSTTTSSNGSYINDAKCNAALAEMSPLSITDPSKAAAIHKELMKYVLDQAWAIPTPAPPLHAFWWPWVKNYHGEFSVGRNNSLNYTMYVWVDQSLKKSMGH